MNFIAKYFSYISYLGYVMIIGKKLKYDLIIASSTPLTVAIPALIFKKLKSTKFVFEIRDLWPQLPIAIGALKSPIMIKIAQFLEKKTYASAEQVIALSPGMASELNGRIPDEKLSVVTNLSDMNAFSVSDQKGVEFRNKFPRISNGPLVVYSGAFGRINGVSYVLEIADEMKKINPNVQFLLAGDGYEKEKLRMQSKKLGLLNEHLFIIDYIPKSEMPSLLSAATITTSFFIDLPEMEHNSANKFFDGLAAGKPIMINYGGWQAELLMESGAGFIIPPNDPTGAAEKLNEVILNDKKLHQMGQAARNLATRFDVNSSYKKFEDVIDRAYFI
jgi:glycosyltransferase involved in cell wall biosynthesis